MAGIDGECPLEELSRALQCGKLLETHPAGPARRDGMSVQASQL